MRLIDADRLKKVMSETIMFIMQNPKMDSQEAHVRAAFVTFGKMLHNAPTIDAVPVVRCKDCRWRTGFEMDDAWHPCDEVAVNNNWFCADGERRT